MTMKPKEPTFTERERELALKLCGKKPSEDEIQWYLDRLEIFATGTKEQSAAAMDAILAGYCNRGNPRKS